MKPRKPDELLSKALNTCTYIKTDAALYKTTTETLISPASKKLTHVVTTATGSWEASCAQVLSALERNPQAKWFVTPVNPEAQNVPNYYEVVKTPMDLQTVRQKLEGGMYSHPFRWQHDVRTIFFNAFTYYTHGSPIWRSAAELAVNFENLCKEVAEVNPYVVFLRPIATQVTQDSPSPVTVPPYTATIATDDVGIMLKEAATATPVTKTQVVTPKKSVLPKKKGPPHGVRIKDGGSVTYSADCTGTELAKHYERNHPVSALPKPVLLAPGLDQNRAASIGVSNSQKKNLPARFRELDVSYRKALLEWVRDELGIHPLLCALDIRYTPDLDLLPPVKAKQFFVHMKALMTQQKQAQDQDFLPTTLPRVLCWDVAETPNDASSISETPQPAPPVIAQMAPRPSWAVENKKVGGSSQERSESSYETSESSDAEEIPPVQPMVWSWNGLGKSCPPACSGGLGLWPRVRTPAPYRHADGGSSCWGEWKVKALQHDYQLKTKANDVAAASESEARAEGADAEI